MEIESVSHEDVVVLALTGPVVPADTAGLAARLAELRECPGQKTVLDLSRTEGLPSAVLGTLLATVHAIEEKGGRMVLVAPAGPARVPLARLGIDKFVGLFDTLEEAVAALKSAI